MWPFRRRRKTPIPTYAVETTPTQLRIIRTHQAAQAGQISTLIVEVGQLGAAVARVADRVEALARNRDAGEDQP